VEEKKEYINIKFKKGRERHRNQIFPPKLLYLSPTRLTLTPLLGSMLPPKKLSSLPKIIPNITKGGNFSPLLPHAKRSVSTCMIKRRI